MKRAHWGWDSKEPPVVASLIEFGCLIMLGVWMSWSSTLQARWRALFSFERAYMRSVLRKYHQYMIWSNRYFFIDQSSMFKSSWLFNLKRWNTTARLTFIVLYMFSIWDALIKWLERTKLLFKSNSCGIQLMTPEIKIIPATKSADKNDNL